MKFLLALAVCGLLVSVASGQCFAGWHDHEDSCYGIGEEPLTFVEAQEFCRLFNASLAEVESEDENLYLRALSRAKAVTEGVFIGGTDMFDEGVWIWMTTRKRINGYLGWAPSEPAGGSKENCLALWRSAGFQWGDVSCKNHYDFICEKPAQPASCSG